MRPGISVTTLLSKESFTDLWKAVTYVKPEPCCGLTKRDFLSEWWGAYRPRLPNYSVTLYVSGDAILSAHGLSRRSMKRLVEDLEGSESWGEVSLQVDIFR